MQNDRTAAGGGYTTPARQSRNRLASARRWHPGSPAAIEAARDHAEHMLTEHIRKIVDQAPPLSEEQRSRLRQLLAPAAGASTTEAEAGGAVAA